MVGWSYKHGWIPKWMGRRDSTVPPEKRVGHSNIRSVRGLFSTSICLISSYAILPLQIIRSFHRVDHTRSNQTVYLSIPSDSENTSPLVCSLQDEVLLRCSCSCRRCCPGSDLPRSSPLLGENHRLKMDLATPTTNSGCRSIASPQL